MRGPLGAVVATLIDAGWDARAPALRLRPNGDNRVEWHLVEVDSEAFGSHVDHQAILRDLRHDIG